MKSTARIGGHPIHPMLIPFPFAFLSGAAIFDLVAASRQDEELGTTARHLSIAGLVSAVVAAVPGLIDYATTVPAGKPRQTATLHMISNVSALAVFGAAQALRPGPVADARVVGLNLLGTALLGLGGWFGGSLTYHHQIGVDPEEERPHPALGEDQTRRRAHAALASRDVSPLA